MGTAKGDGYTVTPRDLELVVTAIGCTRLPFEVEYERLARCLGYKNAHSAKAAWNALRKKLDKVAEGAPVVPSLTIEPEPLRRTAKSSTTGKGDKQKSKQPAVEASSETSDDESGAESDRRPTARLGRSRKQIRFVDDDGDVPMVTSQKEAKAPKNKSKSAAKTNKTGSKSKKRRRPTISSSSNSDSEESDIAAEPKAPRKKLKRKFTQLAVSDLPRAKGCVQGKEKSLSDLHVEAVMARKKAFQMIGGSGDGEDQDDEDGDPPPPPTYVKKEVETGANGLP